MNIKEYNFKKEKEVKKMLNDIFYKDISIVIESYLFVKCNECLVEGLEEYMYDSYNKKFYCLNCVIQENIKKCSSCFNYYNCKIYHSNCPFCRFSCYIYCPICCIKNYKEDSLSLIIEDEFTESEWEHLSFFWLKTTNESKDEVYEKFLSRLDDLDNI